MAQLEALERHRKCVRPKIERRLTQLREQVSPEAIQRIMALVLFHMREGMDTDTMQPFIAITRRFIQKVVIGRTEGHQPASLEVHGQIASILAAMDAATIMEERMKLLHEHDFQRRIAVGEIDTEAKRKKLLGAYAEELDAKKVEWSNLQVSLVARA